MTDADLALLQRDVEAARNLARAAEAAVVAVEAKLETHMAATAAGMGELRDRQSRNEMAFRQLKADVWGDPERPDAQSLARKMDTLMRSAWALTAAIVVGTVAPVVVAHLR